MNVMTTKLNSHGYIYLYEYGASLMTMMMMTTTMKTTTTTTMMVVV